MNIITRDLKEGYTLEYELTEMSFKTHGIQIVSKNEIILGMHIGSLPLRSFPSKVNVNKVDNDINISAPAKQFLNALAYDLNHITHSVRVKNFLLINGWIYVSPGSLYASRDNNLFLFGWPNTVTGPFQKEQALIEQWKSILKEEIICGMTQ